VGREAFHTGFQWRQRDFITVMVWERYRRRFYGFLRTGETSEHGGDVQVGEGNFVGSVGGGH
jgi:hypothetical protein